MSAKNDALDMLRRRCDRLEAILRELHPNIALPEWDVDSFSLGYAAERPYRFERQGDTSTFRPE